MIEAFIGHILNFIQIFLNNRSFKVLLKNSKSATFNQTTGVPQREILSVYLFLIAINSVTAYIPSHTQFILYADDLTLFVHLRSFKQCQTRMKTLLINYQLVHIFWFQILFL